MEKKYELIPSNKEGLFRIRALRDFGVVKYGDIGGYVEDDNNLSHDGDCWIYNDAQVYDNAKVSEHAQIGGNAKIYGNARIFRFARIFDNAQVCGDATISSCVTVYGRAKIYTGYIIEQSDHIVIGPIGSRNDFVTFFKVEDKIMVSLTTCDFEGHICEFENRVKEYHKKNRSGKQYLSSINYVKELFNI